MNKKTMKIAGWALGLSLAVAGIGAAIGTSAKRATEVKAAADEVYVFATAKNTSNTAYGDTFDVDITSHNKTKTWNVPGNQNFSGYVRIGGKSISDVDRVITGNTDFDETISKIRVNHNGISNANLTVNSVTLTVASNNTFATVIDTVALTPSFSVSTEGYFEFTPSSTYKTTNDRTDWAADSFYKVTFNVTNSKSTNYGIDLKTMQFFTETSEPALTWDDGKHPTAGYTGIGYNFKATDSNFTSPKWTWSSSPSEGVTITGTDGDRTITFANAGSHTVTARVEETSDGTIYREVTQVISITASTSTLALDKSTALLGYTQSVEITPTVENTGSYTNENVTVTAVSGAGLVTISGLTDGKVASGSAVTITSKSTTGTAVIQFSCNGNTQNVTVDVKNVHPITYTFTNKSITYSTTGDVDSYKVAGLWTSTLDPNSLESDRGLQFNAADFLFTLTASSSMKAYSVEQVSMDVSSNAAGNSVSVAVNGSDFELPNSETTYTLSNGEKHTILTFSGNECGNVVISGENSSKSIYIKTVTIVLVENAVAVQGFVDNYMKMSSYGGDGSYSESRCTENYEAALVGYAKLNGAQKKLFATDATYSDAATRFGWWAKANGDTFDPATGVLSAAHATNLGFSSVESTMPLVVTVAALGTAAAAGFFLFQRKRKEN